ncbi:MAG TPA: hypothetical protein VGC42_16890 [Kofleriaceae bacterium]
MAKDRARPFSRKHRRYWIPVTGGMILIGVVNVALGYCSYRAPSDIHERIIPDVRYARGSGSAVVLQPVACAPEITARLARELPGAVIVACSADHVSVVRGDKRLELERTGDQIQGVAETLTLPEIPALVMRAFAVAYPRTIPASAIRRTRRGEPAVYELGFPPGAAHTTATLRADGTLVELR